MTTKGEHLLKKLTVSARRYVYYEQMAGCVVVETDKYPNDSEDIDAVEQVLAHLILEAERILKLKPDKDAPILIKTQGILR